MATGLSICGSAATSSTRRPGAMWKAARACSGVRGLRGGSGFFGGPSARAGQRATIKVKQIISNKAELLRREKRNRIRLSPLLEESSADHHTPARARRHYLTPSPPTPLLRFGGEGSRAGRVG